MAQTQQPAPMAGTIIDQYQAIVLQLIEEATRYSAEGPGPGSSVEEGSGNIARIRSLTAALFGAINSIQPRPPQFPMPVPPEPTMQPVSPQPIRAGTADQTTGAAGEPPTPPSAPARK